MNKNKNDIFGNNYNSINRIQKHFYLNNDLIKFYLNNFQT